MSKTIRAFALIGTLALSSLTLANAKAYHIVLTDTAKAGNVTLPAGEYTVKIQGANAVFTGTENAKTYEAAAKVEKVKTRFRQTAVESTRKGGADRVEAIDLGGSSTRLTFSE